MSMRDKRNRAKNFTEAEEIVLVELYEENKTILDITKNNAETWQLKKQIWEDMVDTYYNRTGVRREWTGLRDKYLNMKKKARQENQQDWAYTVRKNIGKVFVKTRSSTSDSAHQYDSDISNEQNGISCEPSQDMYESSVDAHELKRFSAPKKQKREIAAMQWPSFSPQTQRSLDEEKIKLVRIQQKFYLGENKRAQEKHDHEMAKEKFRLDQEAQEGKLKIELMELEIMEKRARLDLNCEI